LVLLFAACTKSKNTYKINQKVKIFYRNRAIFRLPDTTLYLRYSEFKSESRCPPKSTCVWDGVVKVGLNHSGRTDCVGLGNEAVLKQDSILSFSDYGIYRINLLEVGYSDEQFFGVEERSFITVEVGVK
jgi:hypothetical protein